MLYTVKQLLLFLAYIKFLRAGWNREIKYLWKNSVCPTKHWWIPWEIARFLQNF